MTISMYKASIPVLVHALNNLIGILKKGEDYALAKNIESTVLINSRLYPDMFPLSRQVQIVSDVSRRSAARLAGEEAPSIEDTETNFLELIERLQKTIAYLKTFNAEQIDGTEEKDVTIPIGGRETITMKGLPYLSLFVLPNVYFHITTAYDILRHNGVEIGKLDYLGKE